LNFKKITKLFEVTELFDLTVSQRWTNKLFFYWNWLLETW